MGIRGTQHDIVVVTRNHSWAGLCAVADTTHAGDYHGDCENQQDNWLGINDRDVSYQHDSRHGLQLELDACEIEI